ncbi:diguanylate cyclase [Candidatus Methylomirabilis sp.]|uniref:GGDEF domain-containing protein n=1 Tax=Candidatus Methylomirabilis sp. TaxID=2032687 RepID=UPI002A5C9F4A|nr:diguanylate cyclase [Candidatus Methylomirabilis sp.]
MTHRDAKILFVQPDCSRIEEVTEQLMREGFEVTMLGHPGQALCQMYADPPDLVILGENLPALEGEAILRMIRAEPVFRQLPIILLLPPDADERVEMWAELQLSDFIAPPVSPREVCIRSRLCLLRSRLDLDANPLTRLPGNNTILKEIQRRLDTDSSFALAYLDIDSFKAFNDRYGFARGDDALRMTARIVLNAVVNLGPGSGFVGHVGGDDFILLLPIKQIELACEEIIANFDLIAPSLYDETDRRQGFLLLKDRQGRLCRFPLMALSIAVIPSEDRGFDHVGQLIARAAELKAAAKAEPGSVYLIDRRLRLDNALPDDQDASANFSAPSAILS